MKSSVSLSIRNVFSSKGAAVPYDYLVLAPGAIDNYFGHSEWARYAPGMKEVEDATLIRSRLLMSFEAAELEEESCGARRGSVVRDRRWRPYWRGARGCDQGTGGGRDSTRLPRGRYPPRTSRF